jgi:outer membrane receptor for ferrienterochelin and colicin
LQAYYQLGDEINFVPLDQSPVLARNDVASFEVSVRPLNALKIDNTYLFDRIRDRNTGTSVFDDHIVRSKWNWQFNRQLSLRLILQYNATLTNRNLTFLQTNKQFNADFLFTYLVHPGTAIYVGYNSDVQNLDRGLNADPITGGIVTTRNTFINDSRQLFVKVSYLFRF